MIDLTTNSKKPGINSQFGFLNAKIMQVNSLLENFFKNECRSNVVFPSEWKKEKVVLFRKKNDKQ